jgi:hypothetical protein
MGPIGCLETSVRNYHYSLRNKPEERSPHLLRGGSLEPHRKWAGSERAHLCNRRILILSSKKNTCGTVGPRGPVPCHFYRLPSPKFLDGTGHRTHFTPGSTFSKNDSSLTNSDLCNLHTTDNTNPLQRYADHTDVKFRTPNRVIITPFGGSSHKLTSMQVTRE